MFCFDEYLKVMISAQKTLCNLENFTNEAIVLTFESNYISIV